MSHFYSCIKGNRGEATRCGTKGSGIKTTVASWKGSVQVALSIKDGVDWAEVYLMPWQGEGSSLRIYDGPVAGPASSDVDEALRCKTCAHQGCKKCIKYDQWEQRAM